MNAEQRFQQNKGGGENTMRDILLEGNVISERQLREAENKAEREHMSVTDILQEEGLVTQELMERAVEEHFRIPHEGQLGLFQQKDGFFTKLMGAFFGKKVAAGMRSRSRTRREERKRRQLINEARRSAKLHEYRRMAKARAQQFRKKKGRYAKTSKAQKEQRPGLFAEWQKKWVAWQKESKRKTQEKRRRNAELKAKRAEEKSRLAEEKKRKEEEQRTKQEEKARREQEAKRKAQEEAKRQREAERAEKAAAEQAKKEAKIRKREEARQKAEMQKAEKQAAKIRAAEEKKAKKRTALEAKIQKQAERAEAAKEARILKEKLKEEKEKEKGERWRSLKSKFVNPFGRKEKTEKKKEERAQEKEGREKEKEVVVVERMVAAPGAAPVAAAPASAPVVQAVEQTAAPSVTAPQAAPVQEAAAPATPAQAPAAAKPADTAAPEAPKKEEAKPAPAKDEAVKKMEEEMKRKEEEMKKREEELLKQMEEMKQEKSESIQSEAAKQLEDELRQKEAALKLQEEEMERKAQEIIRKAEWEATQKAAEAATKAKEAPSAPSAEDIALEQERQKLKEERIALEVKQKRDSEKRSIEEEKVRLEREKVAKEMLAMEQERQQKEKIELEQKQLEDEKALLEEERINAEKEEAERKEKAKAEAAAKKAAPKGKKKGKAAKKGKEGQAKAAEEEDGSGMDVAKILLSQNYISEEECKSAEQKAEDRHVSTEIILKEEGLVTKELLQNAIAEYFKIPFVDLRSQPPDPAVVELIPEEFAAAAQLVAVEKKEDGSLVIATSAPDREGLIEEIKKQLPEVPNVSLAYSPKDAIESALTFYRKPLETRFRKIIEQHRKVAPEIIEEIFSDAVQLNASDVHFEPQEKIVVVRFRVDGVMHEAGRIPREYYEGIVNRIKIAGNMRIDEHFAAQDGAIRWKGRDKYMDVRVSIVPIVDGEKIVMRLLSEYVRTLTLSDLGFTPHQRDIILKAAHKPFGMILTTGPTGSGKSTTLYGLLKIRNTPDVNISTIEDPVEYKIPGINHIQVNTKAGLTFDKGLRAIVRQDPDIVLVGEIRDNITAQISVNAALTGHLLFSTLHANDAATAVPRLLEMELEPYLLASTLELVMAQRLMRKICQHCRYSYTISHEDACELFPHAERYFPAEDKIVTLFRGKGCSACGETGYRGRAGVFEMLQITPEIEDLIVKQRTTAEINNMARSQGMLTLFEDGLEKVKAGISTLEELMRIAAPPDTISSAES